MSGAGQIRVLVIEAGEAGDSSARVATVEQSLEVFQGLVGGDIEGLTLTDEVSAYINETGKARGLAVNTYADALVRYLLHRSGRRLLPGDVIVGPVVFLGPPDSDGYDTDVPDDLIAFVRKLGVDIEED